MITEKQVRAQLKQVMDPELNIDIVSLGLVYDIKITRNKKQETNVKIVMTLTTPGCPLAGPLEAMVRHSLKKLPGINPEEDVTIELTFDPPWVSDMMSEAAKAELMI